MDKLRMSRNALEVEFKGYRCMGQPSTRWSGQVLKDIQKRMKELVRIENEGLWEERRDWRLC
jgi:hypothetical protein